MNIFVLLNSPSNNEKRPWSEWYVPSDDGMNFCTALGTLASNVVDRFYRLVNCFSHLKVSTCIPPSLYCIQADSCPENFYVVGWVKLNVGGGGGRFGSKSFPHWVVAWRPLLHSWLVANVDLWSPLQSDLIHPLAKLCPLSTSAN